LACMPPFSRIQPNSVPAAKTEVMTIPQQKIILATEQEVLNLTIGGIQKEQRPRAGWTKPSCFALRSEAPDKRGDWRESGISTSALVTQA
jgi:hypothetical protein